MRIPSNEHFSADDPIQQRVREWRTRAATVTRVGTDRVRPCLERSNGQGQAATTIAISRSLPGSCGFFAPDGEIEAFHLGAESTTSSDRSAASRAHRAAGSM